MAFNLLALETSTPRCGVALLRVEGARVAITVREHDGATEHAERVLPLAGELLDEAGIGVADLDAVAFGQGPGGFTGLRVACGVAQGLALAGDLPVVPVGSLLAVAAGVPARPDQVVVCALDARMGEIYLAAYRRLQGAADDTAWETLQEPALVSAAELTAWLERALPAWQARSGLALTPVLAGDGWSVYAQVAVPRADWPVHRRADRRADVPDVRHVARLGWQAWQRGATLPAEQAAPLYVRDKVAYTTAERLGGQGGNPKAPTSLACAAPGRAQATMLPDQVALNPVTESDLDEMAAIEASVQAFPWTRRNFADALHAGYDGCVLRRGGRMLGFCVLMYAPDVAHLLVIAVAKDQHRQGLGSILLRWCESRTRERDIGGILLEARPSNTGALAFYERHGYQRIGVRRGYYPNGLGRREDAVVMQKNLAAVAHDE
jgi:tRNA threonylcarbamoyladenosine biosynthesis protein TsaB